MLSIRTIGRILPRTVCRIHIPRSAAPKQALLQQSIWKTTRAPAVTLSTSAPREVKGNNGDDDLIQKLDSELHGEKDLLAELVQPTSIKDFMENSPFDIIDEPGKEEVTLTRTYGKEKIQLTFSISDYSLDPDEMSDRGFDDENENENGENVSEGENQQDDIHAVPVPVHVVIEKPNKGALVIDFTIREGTISVETCFYYANAEHAYAKSPEKFHERQILYAGPSFSSLDEGLQQLLERYIDERDINTTLALFIQEYMEAKEQKEYMMWLKNVKEFIKA